MARVDLRCRCGYLFFVMEEKVRSGAPILCPLCGQTVGVDGPVAAPRAAAVVEPPPLPPDPRRKLLLAAVAVCALLVVSIVAVLIVLGGKSDRRAEEAPRETLRPVGRFSIDQPAAPAKAGPAPAPAPQQPIAVVRPAAPAPAAPTPAPAPPSPVPFSPKPSAPAAAGDAIPNEVLLLVRQHLLPLPPYYRDLCVGAADRARLEALMASGRGTREDVQFLKDACISDKVKVVREEVHHVAEHLRQLEKDAMEGLPVDRVSLNDGRTLLGRVVAEAPDEVRIERRMAGGVGGMMNLKRADIKSVEKGRGPGTEFKSRWETARKGSIADQVGLLTWCKENGLTLQSRLLAYTILTADPGQPVARAEAELPANPIQRALDAASQGGLIQHQGRSWTAKELKDKLLRDGMTILNGEWYVRKERMISVPGLFRYDRQDDKPVAITPQNGGATCHDTETVYSMVQDLATNSFVEKADVKFLRRFMACPMSVDVKAGAMQGAGPEVPKQNFMLSYVHDFATPPAGKMMTGEVLINVPVGQPIIEASVKTLAEVKPGATIIVYLIDQGQRIKLYSCASREDDLHKLPDVIRGKNAVDLVAVLSMPASYTPKKERRVTRLPKKNNSGVYIADGLEVVHYRQIPDYKATLFPSNSNTLEVFRLKVTVAEPAPALNDLFQKAGAADILRQ